MATLIPSYEKVLTMKVKPEEGELYLLKFLDNELDSSFEVYFNPFMNGDRPDIVIMRKGYGVMVIEVKDYNLDLYELDDRKNFVIKSNKTKTYKSPISQVLKYKDNLYELHIDKLLEKKIKDIRNFNIVSSVVYFHNANPSRIKDFLIEPFQENYSYLKFLKYNIDFIGRDRDGSLKTISITEKFEGKKKVFASQFSDFNSILTKRYLKANKPSFLFTNEIYESFSRFLKPPKHLKEHGTEIPYSKRQMEIIFDSTRKQQRIKGVVGSGKTTVLAARAVQAHKRTKGNVLILTFNITLKNYIKDKISDVREEFPWENFVISNYHLFINSQLNNLGVPVEVPKDFDKLSDIEKDAFFENKYYSNKQIFLERKEDIKTYDVILIDEIQDYKRAWMEIIKEFFLSENGEYVLFGDVKQNIYNNTTDSKDVSTNVRGVTELKNCFRSDFKIKDLAINYQKDIFKDKYEIDNFNSKQNNLELDFGISQQGSINYIHLTNTDNVSSLYTIIHENAINKAIPPNDITILGHSISLLKKFDAFYRYSSNEKTNTMFETFEMVYRMGLNYIKKNNHPDWLKDGISLIKRQNDYKTDNAFNQLSVLFTIYDLYKEYGEKFKDKFDYYASKFKTTTNDYLTFRVKYESEINNFIKDFGPNRQTSNLKMIRNNKKLHFYMNSGTVKISTVHSFKGWESETLFLILEKKYSKMQMTFDEILYTGITRSKANLIIINFGNEEYHNKLKTLIDKVK
jgi:hypothetical protein